MNYPQTLHYLYTTLPMFSRMGSAAFKKDLTNIRLLCTELGNPQDLFKTIHVAGTNGKGSVSHMLAAIFQAAGYKTGLYTSPHLYDFRERIRVNGLMAEEDFIVDFVHRIQPAIEKIEPSFFEITVAMAFDYFAKMKVDTAVIEVGLGGRLDSTNIILPELSIITNIGWDHMNLLGNSLEEIAAEKAGIIKNGVPVVIGEKRKETEVIFKKLAKEKNAPIHFAQDRFEVEDDEMKDESLTIQVHDKRDDTITGYQLDLPGIYQEKNILTVLQALDVLNKWKISKEQIQEALKQVKKTTGLLGRWELIRHKPDVILEVAHNQEGIEQMLAHLKRKDFHQLHLILGMVKDKDATKFLEALPQEAKYYFTQAHIPRAMDAGELRAQAIAHSLNGAVYENVNLALEGALGTARQDDIVIICGSIFLVAEVERSREPATRKT